MNIKKILVVEDDRLVALDITEILELHQLGEVLIANNSADALLHLNSQKVDFVLLDINLNDTLSGIDIARIINKQFNIPFAFLTAYTDEQTLEEVKKTNPVGFIAKPFDEGQVVAAIKIGSYLYQEKFTPKNPFSVVQINRNFADLTDREAEIYYYLATGKSNKDIADAVSLSVNTVKVHLKSLYIKVGVSSRLEAVQKLLNKLVF